MNQKHDDRLTAMTMMLVQCVWSFLFCSDSYSLFTVAATLSWKPLAWTSHGCTSRVVDQATLAFIVTSMAYN